MCWSSSSWLAAPLLLPATRSSSLFLDGGTATVILLSSLPSFLRRCSLSSSAALLWYAAPVSSLGSSCLLQRAAVASTISLPSIPAKLSSVGIDVAFATPLDPVVVFSRCRGKLLYVACGCIVCFPDGGVVSELLL